MKRTATASARSADRQSAENEAAAKVAEAFGDAPFEVNRVDSTWYPRAAEWLVYVDAASLEGDDA